MTHTVHSVKGAYTGTLEQVCRWQAEYHKWPAPIPDPVASSGVPPAMRRTASGPRARQRAGIASP